MPESAESGNIPKLSKLDLTPNPTSETATTKFVIVVTILGIIFFIVLYLIIILKTDNTVTNNNHMEKKPCNTSTRSTTQPNSYLEDKIDDLGVAETLQSPLSKAPPRPFINNFRGPSPASFHPTRPRPTQITYAQLQNYNVGSQVRSPHNIQDIIGYVMPSDKKTNLLKTYLNSHSHDPFYSYKPKDPSDINLLATSNLRFAPPIWKDINGKPAPSPSTVEPIDQPMYHPQATNKRALTLTLNVFPMANDPRREHFYAESSNMMPSVLVNRKTAQPRKMIIHLNLYQPNDILNRAEMIDEDYELERNLIERSMNGLQQVLNKNMKN